MLRSKLHHLFAFSLLVTSLCHRPAQAMGISFDLATQHSPVSTTADENSAKVAALNESPATESSSARADFAPLPIPKAASQPPVRIARSSSALPRNVMASARVLTPPPPAAIPQSRILPPVEPPPADEPIALSFTPAKSLENTVQVSQVNTNEAQSSLPNWIYEGGSDSLVARVIGSAEGTRTASGERTQAYYGHTDPGNGVWNMGTFSYQHGARSPQQADKKQLRRLQKQGNKIAKQAEQAEITMTLGEMLNGLDLANQAPRAALERGGYVDRLAEAREQGMQNSEAIVWARTYSYLNPDTQRWNAPGLGNTLPSIQRDQHRRHDAVARAFSYYQAQREKTGKPPAGTLETPTLEIAQHSVAPINQSTSHEKSLNQPSQAVPIEFSVADSLRPTPEDSHNAVSMMEFSDSELSRTLPNGLVSQGSTQATHSTARSHPHG